MRDGQWNGQHNGWIRSVNGTFVNSTVVAESGIAIHPGDIISIGDAKLRVEGY
ncbi:MAG: FHA domain-containing protein [Tannerella sp.]|nr:FHA domain-containing protein [Tannerella sp.]